MRLKKEQKNTGKKVKKGNEKIETDPSDFLEYDGPYKDDPYKEKDVIIS